MYVPAHFRADDAAVRELLTNHGAADLITSTAGGLLATLLPFIYEEPGTLSGGWRARPVARPRGSQQRPVA